MNEVPINPEEEPNAANTADTMWGPPNPHYAQPAKDPPPAGSSPPLEDRGRPGPSTNTIAALAYLTFIPAIIFLVIEPYRHVWFIRFHAWQCIVLTLVDMAGSILFGYMGVIGQMIRGLLALLLFIFWIVAIIKASRGERYHVPVVGDLAETLAARV